MINYACQPGSILMESKKKGRTRMSNNQFLITMLRFKSAAVSGSLNPTRSAPVHI
jgi:hypothetical protein